MTDHFAAAHLAQTKHGAAKRGAWTPTYRAWRYMRDRVARDPDYAGVTISPRWNDFRAFLADMGECPLGMTLDRLKNHKGYEPENCRWATPKQQANNTSRNVLVKRSGEVKTLAEWAAESGLNYKTVHNRISACGWSAERALTTPHRGWNKSGRIA